MSNFFLLDVELTSVHLNFTVGIETEDISPTFLKTITDTVVSTWPKIEIYSRHYCFHKVKNIFCAYSWQSIP